MEQKNYKKNIMAVCFTLIMYCFSFNAFSQDYVNDMDYVLGDTKQAFITNAITTEEQADNLLLGFKNMGVNGIRIPLFGRDLEGIDLNPNKPMFDYFYTQALAQGFDIFANPAQGGGGARVANNMLNGEVPSVNNIQAATDELIARVLEFSNEYPDCKWLNPFNEDGRATSSTWTVEQINTIYAALYNNVNGAELIGPCTWGLPAAIDMFKNTDITNYITVAASHNLGFNHSLWDDFIALADAENLPVWDSEVNNNDAKGTGTRLEKAIENKVDGLVLYDSWKGISLVTGALSSGTEIMMDLYLKQEEKVNLALDGVATQSSTNPTFNKPASLAIDGDINGNYGSGSVTVTDAELAPWWQVDLGADTAIGTIKIYNRTDGCCKARLNNFTVSVINNSDVTSFSETFTTYPDPSIIVDAGGVQGQIIKIVLHNDGITNYGLTLAEVQVFAPDEKLSIVDNTQVQVSVYPNPVSDTFMVNMPTAKFNQFRMYNINGQVIKDGQIANNTNKVEISLNTLSQGIYILKLSGEQTSRTFKIIKD
ncbi:T9SS type A sorting domain-containing protein [Formosa undariae]|uniref:T9SS type A sorting domain-containing protein n=1 Tax=Formosa undariae TaxID=1325436 RepID=A0ABV5EZY5_9FLAO